LLLRNNNFDRDENQDAKILFTPDPALIISIDSQTDRANPITSN
jgi:hypothetical protein